MKKFSYRQILERFAQQGIDALSIATPTDSGLTAQSWGYEIHEFNDGTIKIIWTNSNVVDNVAVAILIQYGHGTKNGGWVQGYDFINPAISPVFEKIANDAWKEISML
jgi:hypothetical protein